MIIKSDIVTVLYEVNGQQYIIGVTNEPIPAIAVLGVNTPRPLPQNMRNALISVVKKTKKIQKSPVITDYNAPSTKYSHEILSDFTTNPLKNDHLVTKTISDVLEELKTKMIAGNHKEETDHESRR